eukprot:6566483-Prymnesium_polylepis.2
MAKLEGYFTCAKHLRISCATIHGGRANGLKRFAVPSRVLRGLKVDDHRGTRRQLTDGRESYVSGDEGQSGYSCRCKRSERYCTVQPPVMCKCSVQATAVFIGKRFRGQASQSPRSPGWKWAVRRVLASAMQFAHARHARVNPCASPTHVDSDHRSTTANVRFRIFHELLEYNRRYTLYIRIQYRLHRSVAVA